jgi:hypothetical protein
MPKTMPTLSLARTIECRENRFGLRMDVAFGR